MPSALGNQAEAARLCAEAGETPNTVWRALGVAVANYPGDAAIVHFLSHAGAAIRAAAFYHPDPGARCLMRNILALGPHTLVDAFTLRVLRTGRRCACRSFPRIFSDCL